MKRILFFFLSSASLAAVAQPKVLTQAIITTKTTIVSPDDDDGGGPPPPPSADGAEVRVMRFGGDGETKTVTTLKGDMVKTYSETDMGRFTTLRDNAAKKTTTLMEMMGTKSGFYATDEEQEKMRKEMDSLMQSRRQGDGNGDGGFQRSNTPPTYEVVNADGTKKIAGLACKKALVIRTRSNGNKDTTEVWYCPDFKFAGLSTTGGSGGMMGGFIRNAGVGGLDKIEGFPMMYSMNMNRGRKMTVEVTKIVTDKEISDKEFEVPKDYTLKPMSEMQNGGRGFQIRVGGPN